MLPNWASTTSKGSDILKMLWTPTAHEWYDASTSPFQNIPLRTHLHNVTIRHLPPPNIIHPISRIFLCSRIYIILSLHSVHHFPEISKDMLAHLHYVTACARILCATQLQLPPTTQRFPHSGSSTQRKYIYVSLSLQHFPANNSPGIVCQGALAPRGSKLKNRRP